MLAVLRNDLSADKEEIIDMDNSSDLLLASLGHNTSAITWDIITRFAKDDETSQSLSNWISTGCSGLP